MQTTRLEGKLHSNTPFHPPSSPFHKHCKAALCVQRLIEELYLNIELRLERYIKKALISDNTAYIAQ